MKKKKVAGAGFTLVGAISFFLLVALLMQIAILVYDYICEKTDNNLYIALLILVLILILASLCVVFDWVRRILTVERPTQKILDATDKIAKGNFETRLTINHEFKKYNQYDLIMENLNKMASELQKNEVLKTDFISNVSHEIKTPLAVIQNYAFILQDDSLDDETRKKYSKTLLSATKRLSDLITNILKLNKLENQKITADIVKFNLTESLSQAILNFEDLIESKNLSLDCNFDDIIIQSSPSLLEIVWNNLMSNAIKFTSDGGSITASLKRDGNDAIVSIKDTGCGISPETGKRIFEKFYQGDTSHSQQGNGLGLALVKKVIDLLGGEISVDSELGVGSTFTIRLSGVVDER